MTVQKPASTTSNSSAYIKFFKILMFIIEMNFVIFGALIYMTTFTNKYRTPGPRRRNKSDEETFLSHLNQNLVVQQCNITELENRTKVDIILIVSSAPARTESWSAIRQTWWLQCRSTNRICRFLNLHLFRIRFLCIVNDFLKRPVRLVDLIQPIFILSTLFPVLRKSTGKPQLPEFPLTLFT